MFSKLPVELEPDVFKFYESKASIHGSKHPNLKNLQRDFFTDSISRWKQELDPSEISKIEGYCHKILEIFQYETSGSSVVKKYDETGLILP